MVLSKAKLHFLSTNFCRLKEGFKRKLCTYTVFLALTGVVVGINILEYQ